MDSKTIYALSTVYGKSGVAVLRISGSNALEVLKNMTNLSLSNLKTRYAYFTPVLDSQTHQVLDHALILYFKAPYSFTGEDTVEIHCHGSKAVLSSVLASLSLLPDFRIAEPGEYSKRAFYNQKMDLTQAEGLADLIDAETEAQQRYALEQMDGGLKNLYNSWRERLLEVYAYLEAYIDFPDEDIPENIKSKNLNTVFKLVEEIEAHLGAGQAGERLREGFQVVIAGPVNAGKSSLLNAIVNRQAAIVSDISGTTRDAIETHLDINGYPVILTDTAGLRQSDNIIEKQGIEISLKKIRTADLVLLTFDASTDTPNTFDFLEKSIKNKALYIANKTDKLTFEQCSLLKKQGCLLLSAKEKTGIQDLITRIAEIFSKKITPASGLLITRARYREALQECVNNLKNFNFEKEIELSAEDIRLASRALGKITGQIEITEILDKIFGSFCIGK